jgi:predicted PurR-regulated permease PerM
LHKIGFLQEGNQVIQRSTEALGNFVQAIGSKTVTFISGAGSRVLDTILALVIAFYLLKEKVGFTQFGNRILEAFIPSRFTRKLKYFWEDADRVLSGYIRGQLIDALIMGTLIGISLAIIGIDFPIMIGIIAGIFNLIPYFGPVVGIAAAALMGLVSDHPIRALYAAITLMVLQQIDGAIIVPKVVGESVDLHPVAVLLSIVIAGSLFGIIGMLLAVPVTALLKLLFERYMNERLNKQKESAS